MNILNGLIFAACINPLSAFIDAVGGKNLIVDCGAPVTTNTIFPGTLKINSWEDYLWNQEGQFVETSGDVTIVALVKMDEGGGLCFNLASESLIQNQLFLQLLDGVEDRLSGVLLQNFNVEPAEYAFNGLIGTGASGATHLYVVKYDSASGYTYTSVDGGDFVQGGEDTLYGIPASPIHGFQGRACAIGGGEGASYLSNFLIYNRLWTDEDVAFMWNGGAFRNLWDYL